jgi:hypothetical protein
MGGVVDGRARGPYPHLDNAKTPSDRLRDTKIRRQGASRIGSKSGKMAHPTRFERVTFAYLPGTEDQMLT